MVPLRMHTSRLRPGMIIKNNVYSNVGTIIVPGNTPVSRSVVDMLTKHFIDYVMVEYPSAGLNEMKEDRVAKLDPKKLEVFRQEFQIVEHKISHSLREIADKDKDVNIPEMLEMLDEVMKKADGDTDICNMLFHMKKSSENMYTHSINVALFAQIVGRWMKYSKDEIEMLAIGGLLHDIGLLKIPGTDKPGFDFQEEMHEGKYEKHAILGYTIVKNKSVDDRIKQAILTHHERVDGSGFPLAVTTKNINRICRILSVADVYDTLTMPTKGSENTMHFEVLKQMESEYNKLDPNVLITFIDKMSQTFVQHECRLSDGNTGKIILVNKYNLTRPLVQVGTKFIDLAIEKKISILEILD